MAESAATVEFKSARDVTENKRATSRREMDDFGYGRLRGWNPSTCASGRVKKVQFLEVALESQSQFHAAGYLSHVLVGGMYCMYLGR